MARNRRRTTLQATRRSSVGRATYLVANNITGLAGNVLGKVRRPGR